MVELFRHRDPSGEGTQAHRLGRRVERLDLDQRPARPGDDDAAGAQEALVNERR